MFAWQEEKGAPIGGARQPQSEERDRREESLSSGAVHGMTGAHSLRRLGPRYVLRHSAGPAPGPPWPRYSCFATVQIAFIVKPVPPAVMVPSITAFLPCAVTVPVMLWVTPDSAAGWKVSVLPAKLKGVV